MGAIYIALSRQQQGHHYWMQQDTDFNSKDTTTGCNKTQTSTAMTPLLDATRQTSTARTPLLDATRQLQQQGHHYWMQQDTDFSSKDTTTGCNKTQTSTARTPLLDAARHRLQQQEHHCWMQHISFNSKDATTGCNNTQPSVAGTPLPIIFQR